MSLLYSYPENKNDHGRVFPPQAQVRAVPKERQLILGTEVFWFVKLEEPSWFLAHQSPVGGVDYRDLARL